jgi:hypothetical protein
MFSMSWDASSLAKIAELEGMGALLDVEIADTLVWIGELVSTTAKTNTWSAFQNPTGETANSIGYDIVSAKEVAITVGVPYGRRLEYGFSGMTDSLGRTFPYWPAEPYLGPALDEDRPLAKEKMMLAIENVIAKVEGI